MDEAWERPKVNSLMEIEEHWICKNLRGLNELLTAVLQRMQIFCALKLNRIANIYRRSEGTFCLDFLGSSILGLFGPKKLPNIGIHVPNDTESHPTELNPHARISADLYSIIIPICHYNSNMPLQFQYVIIIPIYYYNSNMSL